MRFCIILMYFVSVNSFPSNWIQKIAENNQFDDFENYLPKFGDLPKFQYTTDDKLRPPDDVAFKTIENEIKTSDDSGNKSKDKKVLEDIVDFLKQDSTTTAFPFFMESTTFTTESTTATEHVTTEINMNQNNDTVLGNLELDPAFDNSTFFNDTFTYRFPRQEDVDTGNSTNKNGTMKESQEESEESEEDGNMITGLLSSFLGGLSRPDGSIDLEAITGLLGSLSVQNPDGSYDFNGLTELLMGFFGGGGEEGGGSDLGAFIGGLVGAVLKGSANPPGAKGVGIFTGKVAAGVLPALSGPAPTTSDKPDTKPQQPLDSGSFIGGFLSSFLGSSAGGSSGNGDNGNAGGGGSKFPLFKMIFSLITSVFTSSSKHG